MVRHKNRASRKMVVPDEYARSAFNDLFSAFKSSGPFVLCGLSIGFLLLGLDRFVITEYLDDERTSTALLSLVAEHLGLGFIVAAIAIFFYEWGAHQKHVFRLIKRLLKTHDRLINMMQSESKEALDRGLQELLLEEDNLEGAKDSMGGVVSSIQGIVSNIQKLRDGNIWAKTGYIECISELLKAVEVNTRGLRRLDGPGDHLYAIGGAPTTDRILAVQMRELQAGDKYKVVSHLASWVDGRLNRLYQESERALEREVAIFRIFNLVRDCSFIEEGKVEEVLSRHLELAEKVGAKYKIKVFRKNLIGKGTAELRENIEGLQVAFFIRGGGKLRIDVRKPDLTELSLSTQDAMYNTDLALYEEAWKLGESLVRVRDDSTSDSDDSDDRTVTVKECIREIYGTRDQDS